MRLINFRPPRVALVLVLVATGLHWLLPVWGELRFSFPPIGVIIGHEVRPVSFVFSDLPRDWLQIDEQNQ
jgi:hypothetical protein